MQHHRKLHDIKLPAVGHDDPPTIREIVTEHHDRGESVPAAAIDAEYEFDPADYDPDGEHGYFLHRARKEHLGVSWPDYVNMAVGRGDGELPDAETIAAHVADRTGADGNRSTQEIARRVVDDLSSDVREASYTGAREALQDVRH